MAKETLPHFCEIVLHDPTLQAQLWEASDVDVFLRRVHHLSVEHGHYCSREEVKAALSMSRREWRAHGELATTNADLGRWTPIRVGWRGKELVVEWCYVGERRFTEPFFAQSVAVCLRHPFNKLFRLQTPISTLGEQQETHPGLSPTGFIFHMSRCGSTLIAQLLASLPPMIVLAEAEPIDGVLRSRYGNPAITDEQRSAWLQWVVSALARPRHRHEQYLFIKFDSWSILDLPLIRRAFPNVPWMFLYRDPVEVMVSHQQMRGSQMVPFLIEPALLGLDPGEIRRMSLDEYCARTLASICDAAARWGEQGAGRFVNYRQLPEVVWSSLLPAFGITPTPADIDQLQNVAQFHAKNPSTRFIGDQDAKQRAASNDLRRLAQHWVLPQYQKLVALQQAQEAR